MLLLVIQVAPYRIHLKGMLPLSNWSPLVRVVSRRDYAVVDTSIYGWE